MSDEQPAGLLRRFAIICYDGLLLLAVLIFATTPLVFMNQGDALNYANPWIEAGARIWLLGVAYLYFGWFWTRGQTVGMRTWRTHLISSDGTPPSWPRAALRFGLSIISWLPAGLGYWWGLFHPQRATWHDLASGTRLVVRPRATGSTKAPAKPEPKAEED